MSRKFVLAAGVFSVSIKAKEETSVPTKSERRKIPEYVTARIIGARAKTCRGTFPRASPCFRPPRRTPSQGSDRIGERKGHESTKASCLPQKRERFEKEPCDNFSQNFRPKIHILHSIVCIFPFYRRLAKKNRQHSVACSFFVLSNQILPICRIVISTRSEIFTVPTPKIEV